MVPVAEATGPSDEQLVHDAQAGDRAAMDTLIRRYQGRMMRFAQRQCGDPDRAADAVQDGLLAVVRALPQYRGDSAFSTWVFTIVRNACHRRARRRKHEPAHLDSLDQNGPDDRPLVTPPAAQGPDAAQVVADAELGAALEKALAELDARSREVLLLRDVEGLPAEEVAAILGLGVPAVKSRLHRARVQVRAALAPQLDEQPLPEAAKGCRDVVRLFSRHLEGEIDGALCRRMQAHVDGCPRCRAQCNTLKKTLALCAAVPAEVPVTQQPAIRRALQSALMELGRT
jgi:RNA polymerase sigma-70 factor (ECF subfamily)